MKRKKKKEGRHYFVRRKNFFNSGKPCINEKVKATFSAVNKLICPSFNITGDEKFLGKLVINQGGSSSFPLSRRHLVFFLRR